MMTFACKVIKHDELIRCSFNLNKTEYNLLIFMMDKKQKQTISQVVKKMGLDRTTVQKAMKNLVDKNLVKRTQKNLPKGGYVFLYMITDKNEIKNRMKKIIYLWYKGVEKEIEKL
ncbi:winged helix-turn-helix transcriptional regulator [Candidatus Micrarchaeota archaeon]|nr:winged helix-turn-helix transcriptional regulator [Candidatus Micrarchaeota archaeon]